MAVPIPFERCLHWWNLWLILSCEKTQQAIIRDQQRHLQLTEPHRQFCGFGIHFFPSEQKLTEGQFFKTRMIINGLVPAQMIPRKKVVQSLFLLFPSLVLSCLGRWPQKVPLMFDQLNETHSALVSPFVFWLVCSYLFSVSLFLSNPLCVSLFLSVHKRSWSSVCCHYERKSLWRNLAANGIWTQDILRFRLGPRTGSTGSTDTSW